MRTTPLAIPHLLHHVVLGTWPCKAVDNAQWHIYKTLITYIVTYSEICYLVSVVVLIYALQVNHWYQWTIAAMVFHCQFTREYCLQSECGECNVTDQQKSTHLNINITIAHCLGLGHETMVCAACFFYILTEWTDAKNCSGDTTDINEQLKRMSCVINMIYSRLSIGSP